MLEWLTGPSGPSGTEHLALGDNRSYIEEPPETPAHLFAVKAFKSAFFGTPAPDHPDGDPKSQVPPMGKSTITGGAVSKPKERASANLAKDAMKGFQSPEKHKIRPMASPAKGILVTPGTATTRRKTVSFGELAVQTEKVVQNMENEGPNTSSTKEVKLTLPVSDVFGQQDGATLRRSLFQARIDPEAEDATTKDDEKHHARDAKALKSPDKVAGESAVDITIDLKHPRSKSGQHWKTEYQRYHDKSNSEMRRLIRHSQITKSFAAKKDSEASQLSEKLKRSEMRVVEMEKRVSELASQLGDTQSHGKNGAATQAELVSDLTVQMAQALRYKQKAEKYKLALREHSQVVLSDSDQNENCRTLKPAQAPTTMPESLPLDVPDPGELVFLRTEVVGLRVAAQKAESRAAELERENDSLKHTLARVKEEMKNYETRHQAWEEKRKRKDAKATAQKQALRDQLSQVRLDHQQDVDKLVATTARERSEMLQEIKQLSERSDKAEQSTSNRKDIRSPPPKTPSHLVEVGHSAFEALLSSNQKTNVRSSNPKSARPGVINIASSPPKAQLSNPTLRARRGASVLLPSSRASSMAGGSLRGPLPPDRAAAAKMRLEQRKRSQEIGKENCTP